jgi:hypothetical protein
MAKLRKTFDVFISYSPKDATTALEVATMCRESGLEAFTDMGLPPGDDWSDAIWEALAESRALLTIVSPAGPTPSMAIEIGAARAWNKPIYAVVTEPSSTRLTPGLAGIPLYTTGRLPDVIRSIRASVDQLTDEDRTVLGQIYTEMGVSTDQLALSPRKLESLVKKFTRSRGKVVEGERLLSELFRLRKQGRLAGKRSSVRKRPKHEPTG